VEIPRYVRENLLLISSSGRRLLEIINDLLDFSKLKHGEIPLNIKLLI
jgi:two-component system sensor histidine kinase ChiS